MASPVNQARRENSNKSSVDWAALWILIAGWCALSGWTLSALGKLDRLGYGISLVLFIGVVWFYRKQLGVVKPYHLPFRGLPFRSGHWLPKAWLMLVGLTFIGGLVYHPNNYDYLTYRFSRLLHWTWAEHWHWIPTPNIRMNLMGANFEWLMAPVFVFFRTDRFFFLLNTASFLLLPGLIFSVFYRLGISKRVSWWWMWVLPFGYCYALQAGSASNDMAAAVFTLASFHFLLRAGQQTSAPSADFFLSCLAIALATGSKASNVPLVLPWLCVAFLYRNRFLKIKPVFLAGTFFLASLISFFPTALCNIHFTGSYTGDPVNESKMQLHDPLGGLLGNSLVLGINNFRPPVWPSQVPWDAVLPPSVLDYLHQNYSRFFLTYAFDQIQLEESAGVGIGITASVFLMLVLRGWAGSSRPGLVKKIQLNFLPVFLAVCAGVLAMMIKLGNEGTARMLTPYYPLLIAGVLTLVALDGRVVRLVACRIIAGLAMALTLLLVIISPARPLFPVQWAGAAMARLSPSRVERLERVYYVYGIRYDCMKDLRLQFPEEEKSIGLIQTGDIMEATLWRPYGSRGIVDVEPDQTLQQLKDDHLHLVVVSEYALNYRYNMSIDELTKKWSATVLSKTNLLLRASADTGAWYILALP